jgi:hypothetical protein
MGEIAEMMLDGTLCEGCGVALAGCGEGFPRRCATCARDERAERHQQTMARHQQIKKIPCQTCGRKVKTVGMSDHMRDAHGGKP